MRDTPRMRTQTLRDKTQRYEKDVMNRLLRVSRGRSTESSLVADRITECDN